MMFVDVSSELMPSRITVEFGGNTLVANVLNSTTTLNSILFTEALETPLFGMLS